MRRPMNNSRRDSKTPAGRIADTHISAVRWAGLRSAHNASVFILLALVLVSGMAVVHSTFKNRYAMHELQQLRNQHNELEVQWGQLLIEQSTFGLEGRIERLAQEQLNMQVPDWSGVVMLQAGGER